MATFLPRKSLLTQPPAHNSYFPTHCYMCYVCPEDCYIRSPPSSSTPPPPHGPRLSTFLVLMLCLLILTFLILTYLTIRRYRSSLSNSPRRASDPLDIWNRGPGILLDHHPAWIIHTVGLPQSAIDSIPVFKFEKIKKSLSEMGGMKDCTICLSEFREDEGIRILPECRHGFHLPCIDPWLRSRTNCPVCRAPVMIGCVNTAPVEERRGQDGLETRAGMEIEEARDIIEGSSTENAGVDGDSGLGTRIFRAGRRALSMDFSSEFMIREMCEKSNWRKLGCKNYSERFLQKGPVLMKRSFSFSGKGSMMRKSRRSHDSISA